MIIVQTAVGCVAEERDAMFATIATQYVDDIDGVAIVALDSRGLCAAVSAVIGVNAVNAILSSPGGGSPLLLHNHCCTVAQFAQYVGVGSTDAVPLAQHCQVSCVVQCCGCCAVDWVVNALDYCSTA